MLIIGQPKSGSTSLLDTLHMITGWDKGQRHSGGQRRRVWSLPHQSMVNYSVYQFQEMAESPVIFKRHIPPTPHNFQIVRDYEIKCVILLRNPQRSLEAYGRHRNPHGKNEEKEWTEEQKNNKLVLLEKFYNEWQRLKSKDHVMIVEFKDLVNNPTDIVNNILDFYDLPELNKVVLRRARYSGWAASHMEEE